MGGRISERKGNSDLPDRGEIHRRVCQLDADGRRGEVFPGGQIVAKGSVARRRISRLILPEKNSVIFQPINKSRIKCIRALKNVNLAQTGPVPSL